MSFNANMSCHYLSFLRKEYTSFLMTALGTLSYRKSITLNVSIDYIPPNYSIWPNFGLKMDFRTLMCNNCVSFTLFNPKHFLITIRNIFLGDLQRFIFISDHFVINCNFLCNVWVEYPLLAPNLSIR